jgi:RNA polymerase sigma factor (sigma-70 family)
MTGEPSFDRVFDEGPYVWRVLRRLGVREADREDRAQDVLLAAYQSFPTFDPARALRPWLHGIAFHVVENQRARAHNRREVLMDDDVAERIDEGPGPEQATVEKLDRELLIRLMQGLDLDHRAVVSMHIDGVAMEDIARELGIAVATAYKRLDTSRRKLQAAVARAQRAPRAAGAPPVALSLAALFAAERNRPDDIPADVLARLRVWLPNAVRGVPVGSTAPSPPAAPGATAPAVARLAARVMRSTFVHGAVAGLIAGGLGGAVGMYYYLTHPMGPSPAPTAQSAPRPVLAGAMETSATAMPASSAVAPPSPPTAMMATTATAKVTATAPDESETDLIQTARMAYAHGNTSSALDALNRHARRYPRGQLATDRELLRAQVLEAQRAAATASAAAGAPVAPSATSPPRPRFGIDE